MRAVVAAYSISSTAMISRRTRSRSASLLPSSASSNTESLLRSEMSRGIFFTDSTVGNGLGAAPPMLAMWRESRGARMETRESARSAAILSYRVMD